MTWWARRSGTAGPGQASRQRRTDPDEAVVRAFATRTVRDTWKVDVNEGHRVLDGFGEARFRLQSGCVRSISGEVLCTVRPGSREGGPQDLDRPGTADTTSLLVRAAPDQVLVARMGAASTGPVIALLLPDEGTRPSGSRGAAADRSAATRASLDRPWAESARALGPLSYHATLVSDGEVAGRLCDFAGRTVLTDRRRYVRRASGRAPGSLQAWTLNLLDNPLPDAWLLGVLYGTLLLCPPPVADRTTL